MTRAVQHPRRSLSVADQPAIEDLRNALYMLDLQNKETRGDNDYDTMLRAAALVRTAVAKLAAQGPLPESQK